MGRVSKYRKVKSHDPFYRGQRKNITRGVNLRPDNVDEQPVPKSLTRLMKRAELYEKGGGKRKQHKIATGSSSVSAGEKTRTSQTPTGEGVSSSASADAPDQAASLTLGKAPMFVRRRGEDLKSYLERVDVEANAHIVETLKKQRTMRPSRKKYLKERKKKVLMKKKEGGEEAMEQSSLKDHVRFGEVVKEPPQLKSQPRGSKKTHTTKPLLLHQKLSPGESALETQSHTHSKTKEKAEGGLKRKRDLEEERERVINLYREGKKMREKRKLNSGTM